MAEANYSVLNETRVPGMKSKQRQKTELKATIREGVILLRLLKVPATTIRGTVVDALDEAETALSLQKTKSRRRPMIAGSQYER